MTVGDLRKMMSGWKDESEIVIVVPVPNMNGGLLLNLREARGVHDPHGEPNHMVYLFASGIRISVEDDPVDRK